MKTVVKYKLAKVSTLILVTGFALVGCGAGSDKTSVELIQDMFTQISLKAQDYDYQRNEPSSRLPPEHTKPRGYKTEKYVTDPVGAGQNLQNPFPDGDEKALARGKYKYEIYCGICHGTQGHAADDSKLKVYIPLIPALTSDKVKGLRDGQIYHIITNGQGVMGSYAGQIQNPEDRWAIVKYIRTLK
ncbi:MAG: cytochrome c [Bdellovibrionota bacterium]